MEIPVMCSTWAGTPAPWMVTKSISGFQVASRQGRLPFGWAAHGCWDQRLRFLFSESKRSYDETNHGSVRIWTPGLLCRCAAVCDLDVRGRCRRCADAIAG